MVNEYTLLKFENQPVYCIGDLHGAWNLLKQFIEEKDIENCIIIICGDIGIGFEHNEVTSKKLEVLNKFLKLRDITLIGFRGNHDNPFLFNRKIEDVDKNELFWYSNLKLVPDYTVIQVNGKNLLLIGGATSIDRLMRMESYHERILKLRQAYPILTEDAAKEIIVPSYWDNEIPFVKEDIIEKLREDGILITHVITHTCPSFAYPRHKNNIKIWLENDDLLEGDLNYERSVMDNIYSFLLDNFHPLEEWVYGHYHTHHQEDINGIRFTTLHNTDKKFDPYEITRLNIEEIKI